ncbi:MAG: TetR/AcrR family transcriptional regulator [Thermoleophilaceae bacterium]
MRLRHNRSVTQSSQRVPRTKAEQRARTTTSLIAEARRLFATVGYERVKVADVARRAGVTTGALYHHLGSKRGLFLAVLEQVHEEVAGRIADAASDLEPWDQLAAGCGAFLGATTDPQVQRIMLIDGPAVLGWQAWRKLDAATSMKLLEEVITELVDEGVISAQPVKPLVHLLSGAMNEAALWLAGSESRERDLDATIAALNRFLDSLRARD